jgi:chromosome partitioning protein
MILSITNQKGGVGKTTTVINIGAYLAKAGQRVLVVDLDPQSNLTSGLGVKGEMNNEPFSTVYQMLLGEVDIQDVRKHTRIPNLDILPSTIELAGAEIELVSALSRESILKNSLKKIKSEYDFILIDSPPSLGLLTINSLVAADNVLIPVQSEYFALEGLGQLLNTVQLIKGSLNQQLEVGGVILTMYDPRTNLSKDVTSEVNAFFGDKVFSSIIPRSIKLSEAPSHGLTIMEFSPFSPGALAYQNLVDEIIKKYTLIRPNISRKP